MAMLAMAATLFHAGPLRTSARSRPPITPYPRCSASVAAAVFLVSLLASGLSSSVVGTMAGQVIMQDFVGFRIPLWLRRLVTMLPAVVVVAMGVRRDQALVGSQVVLSLVLPVPMIALLVLVRRRDIMGSFAVARLDAAAAAVVAAVLVLALNVILLLQTCRRWPITFG